MRVTITHMKHDFFNETLVLITKGMNETFIYNKGYRKPINLEYEYISNTINRMKNTGYKMTYQCTKHTKAR